MGMFRQLMGTGAHRRDPLHGIHYVCDFDAKGRSNDEDEPMRSTWTDKATGHRQGDRPAQLRLCWNVRLGRGYL